MGLLCFVAMACVACSSHAPPPPIAAALLRWGTLFQTNFESGMGWPDCPPVAVGTIDSAGSTQTSQGLRSSTLISSGPLALQNTETNLGKLALAFSLSASAARPVKVRVESFNQKRKRTGGIETTIYPPAPNFYQRYALDLSNFTPLGGGRFAPTAPFLSFAMLVDTPQWKGIEKPEICVDNVQFAKPAWYVSASGSDQNDGRTEKTAFATPQKAVDAAGPGDIIDVMNGTYTPTGIQEGIVRFKQAGTPEGWITLKDYPGHSPLFFGKGSWGAIRIWYPDAQATADAAAGVVVPIPAYIEVRGLHIRGNGDTAKQQYPDLMDQAAPETNSNGISVTWSNSDAAPHHLRFADNLVEYCPGAGIGPGLADWVTVENNVIRNNCWTTIYGTSGISLNHGSNFDGVQEQYTQLIRNNIVSGNRTFRAWKQIGKISDGNGIIIDVNQDNKLPPEQRFYGRTLVQNNVSFNNGGSGIHAFKSKRVDIINNTVYLNSASPELEWGQLFVQQCDDIRMLNNIVVAPSDQPVNTNNMKGGDQNNTNIYRANNLYFGGGIAPLMGTGDVLGDPRFVNPSIDDKVANFRLRPGSPGIGTAGIELFSPPEGLNGKPRGAKPDKGAYQQ